MNENSNEEEQAQAREVEAEVRCDITFRNSCPDMPLKIEMMKPDFDLKRFVPYMPSSLERSYKFEVLIKPNDLGVMVDLVEQEHFDYDRDAVLDPEDEKLFDETVNRESLLAAIEKTFEDAKEPIVRHPTKPNVYALSSEYVFPDFTHSEYKFTHVSFDYDQPASTDEEMSCAVIHGLGDSDKEKHLGYFLPTEETLIQHQNDAVNNISCEDNKKYEYIMSGAYIFEHENSLQYNYEENYVFITRGATIYYNPFKYSLQMIKKKSFGETRLVLRNGNESYNQLEPHAEEEEEDEPRVEGTTTVTEVRYPTADIDDDNVSANSDSGTETNNGSLIKLKISPGPEINKRLLKRKC